MEQLKNITEFVVVSNLENRALNAGINKAQEWWRNRHNQDGTPPPPPPPTAQITPVPSTPIGTFPGQLMVTIIRAQDLYESRLSMITASSSAGERPYVVLDCSQQRYQTAQADSHSSNRNPEWSSGNGPFGFNIFNLDSDRLRIWIQQQDPLRVVRRNEPKTLGMCEVNVKQLIEQSQAWVTLTRDNKPAGQVMIKVVFNWDTKSAPPPPPYHEMR